ncbi:MAG TPA: HAMP domain-containing histidine kinase [Candidatus Eisenbergiella intestinipullorum]|nr:HAMP domain-containing histidine kinase [Candidatus Eisenbergiella intestinipullorum]
MLRRKLAESLTIRIFLITVLLLLGAGAVTFGLIAWATPSTYTAVVNDDLARQTDRLVEKLADTPLADSGPLLDDFIRATGTDAVLAGTDGRIVDTGSVLAGQTLYGAETAAVTSVAPAATEGNSSVTYSAYESDSSDAVTITMSEQAVISAGVHFADRTEAYTLYVAPRIVAENLAVRALAQMAPWLLLALLFFSLLCALFYSRYITRPIVRLSGIAEKMAKLDFGWECRDSRKDEIGALGRSLNEMSARLSAALKELEAANQALRGEVEREREQERKRTAFFSAASHELKTPVTILKGQLSGMLEGVGVYRNRDKYLLRSLQITGRMERLIQEMLSIARMETDAAPKQETVNLSDLIKRQLDYSRELAERRGQHYCCQITPEIFVNGNASLLEKAVGNLLSNAILYSPEGAEIRVCCRMQENHSLLTVENTGAHIREDALPHLFEPFYREEGSRNRSTGGSGLGLYLVRLILQQHGAECVMENTGDGVMASVCFPENAC